MYRPDAAGVLIAAPRLQYRPEFPIHKPDSGSSPSPPPVLRFGISHVYDCDHIRLNARKAANKYGCSALQTSVFVLQRDIPKQYSIR